MFYLIRCAICIIVWLILSDKRRWREILPVCFFASLLGFLSDHIVIYYRLWDYHGMNPLLISFLNNLLCYVIITYLFIQFLPKERTFLKMLLYLFFWTTLAAIIEIIHLKLGYYHQHKWWRMLHSYTMDWLLYIIFYYYYVIFKFEKLSKE